jgi:hypothetical protein
MGEETTDMDRDRGMPMLIEILEGSANCGIEPPPGEDATDAEAPCLTMGDRGTGTGIGVVD